MAASVDEWEVPDTAAKAIRYAQMVNAGEEVEEDDGSDGEGVWKDDDEDWDEEEEISEGEDSEVEEAEQSSASEDERPPPKKAKLHSKPQGKRQR